MGGLGLLYPERAHGQCIELALFPGPDRIMRRTDNGFLVDVEAGVDQ